MAFTVVAQRDHLFGDGVHGFIPGNRYEAWVDTLALVRVGSFQRHFDTIGIVHQLQPHMPLGATEAIVGFAQMVPPNFDRSAVLDQNLDRAPCRARLAGGSDPLAFQGFSTAGNRAAGFGLGGKSVQHGQLHGQGNAGSTTDFQKVPALDFHSYLLVFFSVNFIDVAIRLLFRLWHSGFLALMIKQLSAGPALQKGYVPGLIAPIQFFDRDNYLIFTGNGGFKAIGFHTAGQARFRRVPETIRRHGKYLLEVAKTGW